MDVPDCGYIAFDVEAINLTFSDKQGPTVLLKVDAEFLNCGDNAKWQGNSLPKTSTNQLTAVPTGPAADKNTTEFPFICGFSNSLLRSSYLDLQSTSISSLINGTLSLKVMSVTETQVAAGKGAKTVRATEGAFPVKEVTNESVETTLTNIRKLCR